MFWGGGGGWSDMKGVGMLVVLLREGNFGFWYHLITGHNAIMCSQKGTKVSFRVAHEEIKKIYVLHVYL